MKILIVEPEQELRLFLSTQLSVFEHEPTLCDTAKAALEGFQQQQFSLILLNQQLPDMDGIELCRKLRTLRNGKACMILILTDQNDPQILKSILEAGADDYLLTPMRAELFKVRLMVVEQELQRLHQRNQALKALQPSLVQIERAKQEWEATADSLTSIVCLLDSQGVIVRANKAIENWQLGKVLTVKGTSAHALLHAVCSDPACYFQDFLHQALQKVARGKSVEREVEDRTLHRHLHLQLRPIKAGGRKTLKKKESFAVLMITDITKRKQMEKAVLYQKTLLNEVANALNTLLIAPDFQIGMRKALETLGTVTAVDRMYIFKTHPHPDTREPAMSRLYEWVRKPQYAQIEHPEWQNLPCNDCLARWYTTLNENRLISGLTRDFPALEQEFLTSQDTVSTLLVPITMNDRLWGGIGFDTCQQERQWREEETTILFVAATSIGGALVHKETEERFHHTSTELRAVFQSLPDEYFRLNANGSILDYKVEEGSEVPLSRTFILRWAAKLLPEEIEYQFDAAIAKVLKTKQPTSLTFWMSSTGEETRKYQEVRVFPFLEDQVLVVVRDMTQWKLTINGVQT